MSVETILKGLTLYLELGALVAMAFVALVEYLDRAACCAYAFRPLLLPAAVCLWPFILVRLVLAVGGRS